MSVAPPIKKQEQARIPNSRVIKAADKPAEAVTKPEEPVEITTPEAK